MSEAAGYRYLIALGSNVRHPRLGPPRAVLAAVPLALEQAGLVVEAMARVVESAPVGPSRRRYANGALLARTALGPRALLALLKQTERAFGRRRGGQRWGARVLDLDIVLWSGGCWGDAALVIPHREFRARGFVLGPAAQLAPRWRDPLTGLTLCQLRARLGRR